MVHPTRYRPFSVRSCLLGPVIALLLAIVAPPVEAQIIPDTDPIAHPYGIPDLCAAPTNEAVASGDWSNAATWSARRPPAANDVVGIPAGVTVSYDVTSAAAMRCVGVHGTLAFRADVSTRLTAATIIVRSTGTLRIGSVAAPVRPSVTAEIVFADAPIDASVDPHGFGAGLIALGRVEIHGAARARTAVELSGPVFPVGAARHRAADDRGGFR